MAKVVQNFTHTSKNVALECTRTPTCWSGGVKNCANLSQNFVDHEEDDDLKAFLELVLKEYPRALCDSQSEDSVSTPNSNSSPTTSGVELASPAIESHL